MKCVRCADGRPAVADDMPPAARAIALLLEHVHARRGAGLPLPCPCVECARHREAIVYSRSADGTALLIEAARS